MTPVMVHTVEQEPRPSQTGKYFWFSACIARMGRGDLGLYWCHHDDGHQSRGPLTLQYWVGSGKFRDIFVAPHLIDPGQRRNASPSQCEHLACEAFTISSARYPVECLVAEPGRALVREIPRKRIPCGVFMSVPELVGAIDEVIRLCNKNHKSFGGLTQLKTFWRRPGVVKPSVRQ
jgi:hypothetical protein